MDDFGDGRGVCIGGMQATLAETAGKYCYGDAVTVADLCLVPQV